MSGCGATTGCDAHRRAWLDGVGGMVFSETRRAMAGRPAPHHVELNPVGPWSDFEGPPPPGGLAGLGSAPMVSIYFSAGLHEGYGPVADRNVYSSAGLHQGYGPGAGWNVEDYQSCNKHNTTNCAIWRVRAWLGTGVFGRPRVVVENDRSDEAGRIGAVMPALSPDGTRLAYRRTNRPEPDREEELLPTEPAAGWFHEIRVRELGSGVDRMVASGDWVRFPAWYDGNHVVYTRSEGDRAVLMEARVPRTPSAEEFTRTVVLGVGSGVFEDTNFEDPDVRRSDAGAALPGFVGRALYERNVATFGRSASDAHEDPEIVAPRVHSLGSAPPQWFQLGTLRTQPGTGMKECQHPSWSLDGRSIHCWNHSDRETWGGSVLQTMYAFENNGSGVWEQTPGGWSFEPPLPDDLEATASGSLFPPDASAAHLGAR